jgi:hypothetical protein
MIYLLTLIGKIVNQLIPFFQVNYWDAMLANAVEVLDQLLGIQIYL